MAEIEELLTELQKKTPLVAMLAPSFIIMYDYPTIVTQLKSLGFKYVVEVAAGAKKTNEAVAALLKADPTSRFITSPCPSFVRLIRKKYPHLEKYLAFAADSPMIATARIVKEKYPECRPVFIGPCLVKKLESSEDYPELNILVLTYKELNTVFEKSNSKPATGADRFDITARETRIYPIDGGLSISGGVKDILKPNQLRIVSGWENCARAIEEFEHNPEVRFVDVLFCEGGCINGPGIQSDLSREQREEKVKAFAVNN